MSRARVALVAQEPMATKSFLFVLEAPSEAGRIV